MIQITCHKANLCCSHQKRKETAHISLQAFKIYTFSATVMIKIKITFELSGRKSQVKMLRSFSKIKILHDDVEGFHYYDYWKAKNV